MSQPPDPSTAGAGPQSTEPALARAARRWTLGLVLAWLVARGLAVFALGDVYFWGEELEKGEVARLLGLKLAGHLDVPWHLLPYHPYEGGGFVASHLKLIAFALVGENVLAHKLCALGWGVLVLLAGLAFARRHLGEGAARWFGLLLVCGPIHWQKESLLHLGIHFEALLFALLVLDRGLRLAATPRAAPARSRDLVLLGLAGGFGLWFSYQLALPLALVLALLLARRTRAVVGREGALALGAFLVGAAPLLYMAARVGRGVLDVHGADIGGAGGFARLAGFLGSLLGALGAAPVAALGAAALTALALVGLARGARRAEEGAPATRRAAVLLLAAYGALWLVAAGSSGLVLPRFGGDFALLRWAPLVLVGLTLAAVGAAVLPGRTGRFLGGAAVAAGLVQVVALAAAGDPGSLARNLRALLDAPGRAPLQAYFKLAPRQPGVLAERVLPFVRAGLAGPDFGAIDRAALAAAAVHDAPDSFEPVLQLLAATDPAGRNDYVLGLGEALHYEAQGDLARALERAALHPPEEARLRAEALGRFGASGWLPLAALPEFVERTRGAPLADAYRRGLGRVLFTTLVLTPAGSSAYATPPTLLRPEAARAAIRGAAGEGAAADVLAGFDAERRAAWDGR